MARLQNDEIISMVRMRTVPVYSKQTSHSPVIERKGTEMFGKQDNGQSLIFIGTKSPGGHNTPFSETEFKTKVVEPGQKFRIGHDEVVNLKRGHLSHDIRFVIFIQHG
jgi:hypothetical protein